MSIHSITFLTSLMLPHCNGSVFPANYHPQTHHTQTSTIICSMLMSVHFITFLNTLMWPHTWGQLDWLTTAMAAKINVKFFIIHWSRCKTLYLYALYITVISHNCLGISDHWQFKCLLNSLYMQTTKVITIAAYHITAFAYKRVLSETLVTSIKYSP